MSHWDDMTNVTFAEIQVGQTASMSRVLTQTDIEVLAMVSGDVDPFHVVANGASSVRPDAHTTEAPGAEALVAAVLGTRLPGPGLKIVRENFEFQGTISVGDELTATVRAREKRERNFEVDFECQCVNQHGDLLVRGIATVVAPTKRLTYTDMAPPDFAFRHGDAFSRIYKECEGLPPLRCAVVHPCDRESLLGAVQAAERGIIEPVLIGPEDKILAVAEAGQMNLRNYEIVSVPHSHASALRAVEMARAGQVEGLMKGSLHTDELLGAVVPSSAGLRTARRLSHVFVMDVPAYPRMLLITDAGINIYPKLQEKIDIVQNAIDVANVLGITPPKVAILSAVETVTPKITSTLEAAALCKMAERGQITGGILDGPLAFDNAVSLQAAKAKKISSPVAGQADILVAPDLEAGNMLAKQLSYLAGAEGAGIVVGARLPIVVTSRADSARVRLTSTAVMALLAHSRRKGTRVV